MRPAFGGALAGGGGPMQHGVFLPGLIMEQSNGQPGAVCWPMRHHKGGASGVGLWHPSKTRVALHSVKLPVI